MSCNGFEKGSVQLPTKAWKQFRDSFYSDYNYKLQELYEIALKVHKAVSQDKKGKRNYPLNEKVETEIRYHLRDNYERNWDGKFHFTFLVEKSLIKNNKLVKPKKQDFKPLKPNKDFILEDDCLGIKFDNKTRTVYYSTDDGNHSIDQARESFLGKLFFRKMNRVEFTSKTGGYLKSETEYHEDENGFSTGPTVSKAYGKYVTSPKYRKELYGF